MSSESISEQLLSITVGAQEHTLYMQELGVESLEGMTHKREPLVPQVKVPLTQAPKDRPLPVTAKVPVTGKQPHSEPPAKPFVAPSAAADTLFGNIFQPPEELLPESSETFEQIWADVGNCQRCPLYQGRTNIVHTDGNRR